jgi:hypothetical protein
VQSGAILSLCDHVVEIFREVIVRQVGCFERILHNKMATFRPFRCDDLNKLSKCNLDPLTETYELSFYLGYYAKWPSLFHVCEDMDGNILGYGKQANV